MFPSSSYCLHTLLITKWLIQLFREHKTSTRRCGGSTKSKRRLKATTGQKCRENRYLGTILFYRGQRAAKAHRGTDFSASYRDLHRLVHPLKNFATWTFIFFFSDSILGGVILALKSVRLRLVQISQFKLEKNKKAELGCIVRNY